MLRKTTMTLSVIVLSWWMTGGDGHTLKRSILGFVHGQTEFASEGAAERSDWGGY